MNRIIRYTQPRGTGFFPVFANRRPWIFDLETEADRLLAAALADFAPNGPSSRLPVDLYEDKANTYVRAELPGVSREAIALELVDGNLALSATRKEGEKSFTLTRSISIPEAVQADKVTAVYENGVLTVTLPKQEQAKPQKTSIAVN